MTNVQTAAIANRPAWAWLSTAGRLVLAAVWLAAGLSKITDLDGSVRAVRAYRVLPEFAAQLAGAGLPAIEVLLGVLLLVGAGVRVCASVSAVLMAVYIVGIASVWLRGLRIDCGCFGGGGELAAGVAPSYGWELARDAALLLLALLLARWPSGRFAVDGMLRGGEEHRG
jgi:uncharacterized membrane protein YphA (DoxX/SURF4 family)